VTIASAPLWDETAIDLDVIWVWREGKYFYKGDWTAQITLIRLEKFRCVRKSPGQHAEQFGRIEQTKRRFAALAATAITSSRRVRLDSYS
jgi:hypothetical protein